MPLGMTQKCLNSTQTSPRWDTRSSVARLKQQLRRISRQRYASSQGKRWDKAVLLKTARTWRQRRPTSMDTREQLDKLLRASTHKSLIKRTRACMPTEPLSTADWGAITHHIRMEARPSHQTSQNSNRTPISVACSSRIRTTWTSAKTLDRMIPTRMPHLSRKSTTWRSDSHKANQAQKRAIWRCHR